MVNPVSTTLNPSNRNGGVNQLDYAIQSRIYDLNTMLPCKVLAVNSDGTYNVQSLLYPRNAKGQPATDENSVPINPPILYNVTAGIIAGGVCAIIIPYAVGDAVWVSFCQRDITNAIAAKFQTTTPASARSLSLCDGVIKCHINNKAPSAYTTTITFGADGALSVTTTSGKPVNLTSGGDVNVNATGNATVTANEVDINSSTVKLGNSASNKVLLEGVALTANITGVNPGAGVANVQVTFIAGGSSVVQAAT